MLSLEQVKFLMEHECDWQQLKHGCCDECPIYNLFGRSGQCDYRLYDSQYRPEVTKVTKVIRELQEKWKHLQ